MRVKKILHTHKSCVIFYSELVMAVRDHPLGGTTHGGGGGGE